MFEKNNISQETDGFAGLSIYEREYFMTEYMGNE